MVSKTTNMEKLREIIRHCIEKSAEILNDLYVRGRSDLTSLVIPKNQAEDSLRISEQELRFVFCSQLERTLRDETKKENKIHYCVEEPTKDLYKFSEKGIRLKDPEKGKGQAANFDLTIENEGCKALIEFKAKAATPYSYKKDFCKLWNPKEDKDGKQTIRFFINIFERTTFNKEDFNAFIEKKLGNYQKQEKKKDVEVVGVFLRDKKADIILL